MVLLVAARAVNHYVARRARVAASFQRQTTIEGNTMTRTIQYSYLALMALWLQACATSFTGSAHIEGGRSGCESKCAGDGLTMSGLVYLGEYSSACVCSVATAPAGDQAAAQRSSDDTAGAAAAGAVAGVMMQMAKDAQDQPPLISFGLQQ
jgi:hypothetical protein